MFYEGTWEPEQAAIPETFEEGSGTTTSVIMKERKSCWNCYKIFAVEEVFKAFAKLSQIKEIFRLALKQI